MKPNLVWMIGWHEDAMGTPCDPPSLVPRTASYRREDAWSKAIDMWPGYTDDAPNRRAAINRLKRRMAYRAYRVTPSRTHGPNEVDHA